jgi:putative hemolysin
VALELVHSPNRFLSTVQIGVTLVGVMAGAFGDATIAEEIRDALQALPALAPYGEAIGLAVVVIAITCFPLVLGELVPKRIGLNNLERIAMFMAKPMQKLSVIEGRWLVFWAFRPTPRCECWASSKPNRQLSTRRTLRC